MQIIIFLIEVIIITYLLNIGSSEIYSSIQAQDNYFNSYSTMNYFGESVLFLSEVPKEKRFNVWQNSSLKDEMLLEFPNIEGMLEIVENNIIGDEEFKNRLVEYIKDKHGDYLSQEINYEEFKRSLTNPNPELVSF